jgi:hypothetical protein
MKLGLSAIDWKQSLLNQSFEPMTPNACMVMWMQNKLMPYQNAMAPNLLLPIVGAIPGALVIPGGRNSTPS